MRKSLLLTSLCFALCLAGCGGASGSSSSSKSSKTSRPTSTSVSTSVITSALPTSELTSESTSVSTSVTTSVSTSESTSVSASTSTSESISSSSVITSASASSSAVSTSVSTSSVTSASTSESVSSSATSSEVPTSVSTSESSSMTSTSEFVPVAFPAEDIELYFSLAGLDVVVPMYEIASEFGTFEIDDSVDAHYDVYPIDTTSAELVAYKEALKEAGWVVVSADEETSEDFRLQYGETDAYVDLLDYTSYAEEGEAPYNLVSFFVKRTYTVESAIDAVASILSSMLGETIEAVHSEQGHYLVLNFGDTIDEATLQMYSDYLFVPEGFEAVQEAWQSSTSSDGTEVSYIDYLSGTIALEYSIYYITEPEEYSGMYYQVESFEVSLEEPEEESVVEEEPVVEEE